MSLITVVMEHGDVISLISCHGNKSATTQLGSESASTLCTKKVSPAAVVTHREQQEATTHCGREFEIRYFDFNERSYSINLQ